MCMTKASIAKLKQKLIDHAVVMIDENDDTIVLTDHLRDTAVVVLTAKELQEIIEALEHSWYKLHVFLGDKYV